MQPVRQLLHMYGSGSISNPKKGTGTASLELSVKYSFAIGLWLVGSVGSCAAEN